MDNFFKKKKEKNTIVFFFFMIFIFAVAFDPMYTVDKKILASYDKIKHIAAFFVLSYFLFESSVQIHKIYKFVILITLALFIEYVQDMIGRESSLNDIIASISGILLFIFIKSMIKRFYNNIKRS